MKTKTTVLLLSLVLTFGLLAERSLADAPSGLPEGTSDNSFPDLGDGATQPLADNNSLQNGMNSNFEGTSIFPQEQTTFVPLTKTLEDVIAGDEPPCIHPIVFTKRDALENTVEENIITIPQGQWIKIDLGQSWIEGVYNDKASSEGYIFHNPWSLQQENKNLKPLMGGWEDEGARPVMPPKKQWCSITQKYGVYYCLYATAVGETKLTFTYHGQFSTQPKTLTFQFNVVQAPTPPVIPDDSNNEETTP